MFEKFEKIFKFSKSFHFQSFSVSFKLSKFNIFTDISLTNFLSLKSLLYTIGSCYWESLWSCGHQMIESLWSCGHQMIVIFFFFCAPLLGWGLRLEWRFLVFGDPSRWVLSEASRNPSLRRRWGCWASCSNLETNPLCLWFLLSLTLLTLAYSLLALYYSYLVSCAYFTFISLLLLLLFYRFHSFK